MLTQGFNTMVERLRTLGEAVRLEEEKAEQAIGQAEQAAQTVQIQGQRLNRNIGHMLAEMERFASGDLTVHLNTANTEGEIATLYEGFNQAVGTIDAMLHPS